MECGRWHESVPAVMTNQASYEIRYVRLVNQVVALVSISLSEMHRSDMHLEW
jgi:hypothetical protein